MKLETWLDDSNVKFNQIFRIFLDQLVMELNKNPITYRLQIYVILDTNSKCPKNQQFTPLR